MNKRVKKLTDRQKKIVADFSIRDKEYKKQTREFYKEVYKHKAEVIKELGLEYPVSNSLSQEQAEIIETMVSVLKNLAVIFLLSLI